MLYGLAYYKHQKLEAELQRTLFALEAVAEKDSAENLAIYIDKHKDSYPGLVVLLAQRTKVTTLLGNIQFQTRWLAGTMRFAEWPQIPLSASAADAGDPYLSDTITMTAYRGNQESVLAPVTLQARYAYFPEREPAGRPGLLLIVGRNQEAGETLQNIASITAIALIFFVPVFVAFNAFLTAGFVAKRIDEISDTSENIIRGNLSRRVPGGRSGDEFDRLSGTLNRMLDQIERLLNGMKEVTDNIAHDLRTPLVRLRSRVELALLDVDTGESAAGPREALEVALKEAERLLATFNALLSIARLEAGVARENVDKEEVGALLRDVAELYEPAAEERGLRLVTSVPGGLLVRCNRELIVQALSNLVDNALKYSPEDTQVTLSARAVPPSRGNGAQVEIAIGDEGPGIPAEERERVLKRFVRLDRGRGTPGSGLGLSLVSAIAQLHDAALSLDAGPGGRGLIVRLVFAAA